VAPAGSVACPTLPQSGSKNRKFQAKALSACNDEAAGLGATRNPAGPLSGAIRQRVHFPQRSDRLACTRPWAHRLRLGGAGKRSTGSEEDVSDLRGEQFTVPVDDYAFGALRIGLGGG
jgi:hypothetical protein